MYCTVVVVVFVMADVSAGVNTTFVSAVSAAAVSSAAAARMTA